MTAKQIKTRLELIKLALGCAILFVILVSSCENRRAATQTLDRVIRLESVVQECSAGACPIENAQK